MEYKRPLRILFLTKYGFNGASSRYRVYQFLPELDRQGLSYLVMPLVEFDIFRKKDLLSRLSKFFLLVLSCLKRLINLFGARSFDVIVVQKEIIPRLDGRITGWLFSLSKKPVIRDFDDADYIFNPRLGRSISFASLVICGNNEIAKWAGNFCKNTVVLPTVIDLDRYDKYNKPLPQKETGGPLKIVWIGSSVTVHYLETIKNALVRVSTLYNLELIIIGAEWSLSDIKTRCFPWSYEQEVALISSCDIGIMPLIDGSWERGKCGLKILQYMGCRLPVVASAVGVNKEIVREGIDGYLADTSDDWVKALSLLGHDANRRHQMGQMSYERVRENYSLERYAPEYVRILKAMGRADNNGI